ncbi:MDIS1-interacting receptor like kinase 2-like [Aristolochia californica]|uniref:MDIS1-interacting receptor like kinase 2-like n=1 Tax=Aristolochia californica TaxID=171875 RepID=UPI0035DF07D0
MRFSGKIPFDLENVSYLEFLDVASNIGSRWFHVINSFSSLQILDMQRASLSSFPLTPSFLNLTQLNYLDRSSNDFYGNISSEFVVMLHLEELYLWYNYNLRVNCSNLFSGNWKNIKAMELKGG